MISGSMSLSRRDSRAGAVVQETRGGPVIRIRVQPRSSRSEVTGISENELRVAVRSAPDEGRATAEAIRVVAEFLGLAPSRLELAGGAASRSKRLRVAGETASGLRKRLAERSGGASA
jgi:hypothetical protein